METSAEMEMKAEPCKTFREAYHRNPTVQRVVKSGGGEAEAVVALVNELEAAWERVGELERIAPRRFVVGGEEFIWRCPAKYVPVMKKL